MEKTLRDWNGRQADTEFWGRPHESMCPPPSMPCNFDPELHKIVENANLAARNFNRWSDIYGDFGCSWNNQMTQSNHIRPPCSGQVKEK